VRDLPPGSGLAARFQLVPFQRSISVLMVVPTAAVPTAQASCREIAVTLLGVEPGGWVSANSGAVLS